VTDTELEQETTKERDPPLVFLPGDETDGPAAMFGDRPRYCTPSDQTEPTNGRIFGGASQRAIGRPSRGIPHR
jgi:hypothetical protein